MSAPLALASIPMFVTVPPAFAEVTSTSIPVIVDMPTLVAASSISMSRPRNVEVCPEATIPVLSKSTCAIAPAVVLVVVAFPASRNKAFPVVNPVADTLRTFAVVTALAVTSIAFASILAA